MIDDIQMRDELLARIGERRRSINAYLRDIDARGTRLNNISIVSSAVTSALTAGPALGGEQFVEGVQQALALQTGQVVWRVLCLLAMICSITAAVSTNMYKTQYSADQIGRAESCNAKLEELETMLQFGQVPVSEAVKQYQQCIAEVPFVRT